MNYKLINEKKHTHSFEYYIFYRKTKDPWIPIRIHIKMKWIRNTGLKLKYYLAFFLFFFFMNYVS